VPFTEGGTQRSQREEGERKKEKACAESAEFAEKRNLREEKRDSLLRGLRLE
jgi:hypothetical protein